MALTDEQRTMLQLLVTGQSYDDIAGLLGISSDDVRSRARDALREMGGADPDAQVQLSDYLLGQADPIGRADASRHLQNDPAANELAGRLVSQLRLLSPSAQLPEIPAPKGARGAPPPPAAPSAPTPTPGAPPTPAAPSAPGARPSLSDRVSGMFSRGGGGGAPSKRRSQIIVGLGAGALLLVVAVLAIAGVFGGGDDEGSGDETATTPGGDEGLVITQLAPLSGDTGASGQAVFAQANDQPLLQINLTGLQPAGKGQLYIVWLYSSDQFAFPIARDRVGQNGNLTGAAPIPQALLGALGSFGCIDVSLSSSKETQAALQEAAQGQTPVPRHSGESVLRGQIPTAPGEEAPSGADSQCEVAAPSGAGAGGAAPGGAAPGGAAPDGTGSVPPPTP
jgi:hypothetical protein